MKFSPLTEEQLHESAFALLPKGAYRYQVISAEDRRTRTGPNIGNEYIALTLAILPSGMVFTNLALPHLLKHFCDVNGLQDDYMTGNLAAARCMMKSGGHVMIDIEKEKPNASGGFYPAKNIVKDYVATTDASGTVLPCTGGTGEFGDEVPF